MSGAERVGVEECALRPDDAVLAQGSLRVHWHEMREFRRMLLFGSDHTHHRFFVCGTLYDYVALCSF